jgi:hypothetical protein
VLKASPFLSQLPKEAALGKPTTLQGAHCFLARVSAQGRMRDSGDNGHGQVLQGINPGMFEATRNPGGNQITDSHVIKKKLMPRGKEANCLV